MIDPSFDLQSLLSAAVPLMLAGLGGLFTELAGALGVFLEGFMILGSFFSWTAARALSSAPAGIVLAALGAACLGWALARFVRLSGANPFIAGLALNLAAFGVVDTLSILWYGTKGVLADPSVRVLAPFSFFGRSFDPFVLLAWAAAGTAALFIHRTKLGLRLRASGSPGEAALERGIDPPAYREGAWAAAAALAALAGAALTFRVGAYAPGGVAGRGWIALAAVYLGFRRVWGICAAALVFALAEQAASAAQGASIVPATLLLGLPSALALILFTLSSILKKRRSGGPPPL